MDLPQNEKTVALPTQDGPEGMIGSFEGQWTVGQWAPLDGRVINPGIRLGF